MTYVLKFARSTAGKGAQIITKAIAQEHSQGLLFMRSSVIITRKSQDK